MTRDAIRRRRARGFTLIELLVALALTAALLAVLFAGIGLGIKGMARLDDQVGRIEARRSLEVALRREIAAAYPASEGPAAAPTFVGRSTVLSFLSLDSGAGPAFTRVWLMVEDTPASEGGGRALILMRRPQAPGLWFGFERTVLARGVARFHLAYYGAPAPSETPAWHDTWEGYRVPPELIRVSLALDGDGAYTWPDEVVRVWAGAAP